MLFYNNRLSALCIGILLLISNQFGNAQSFALTSNDDFGKVQMLYMDDFAYPMFDLDEEVLRVVYSVNLGFEKDTTRRIEMQYVLQVGPSYSKYVSLERFQSDSLLLNGDSQIFRRAQLYNNKANFLLVEDCYYISRTESRLTFTGRLAADDFRYEEILPEISWRLSREEREICGYKCMKATGQFRGRLYEAWFAPKLPSPAGPWKIQGLPGVILSVQDSEKACMIEATRIIGGSGKIRMSEYPYIKVSRQQYEKMQRQILHDPILFAQNHSSRSNWITNISENHVPQRLPQIIQLEK